MKPAKNLRAYQNYFAQLMVDNPAVLLAVGMALGKTAAVLRGLRRLFDRGEITRALIIGPVRVAKYTWPEEIEGWAFSRVLSYRVIAGDPDQRAKLLNKLTDITIINRENIPWLVEYYKGRKWPFDAIIYDESSRMKSGRKRTAGGKKKNEDDEEAKPSKARSTMSEFGALCSIRKYVSKVVEMSGTPSPNGLIDLWGQIYFLDQGKRLGRTMTDFKRRWFDSDYMGYKLTPKPHAHKEIMGLIQDVMFGLRPGDYVDLPKEIKSNHEVVLPKKLMDEYQKFKRSCVSEKYDVEALSRGVLTSKLLQFSNGSMYRNLEDGSREVVSVHKEKLLALDDIVRDTKGENLIVAYSFEFDKVAIKKRYPHAVIFDEEPDAYDRWKSGDIEMLLAHPASLGHGLNMQFGGHWMIWYGLTWSLELYQQMNARLPRPGQRAPCVFTRHIVCRGTDDERVLEVLSEKGATQDRINDAVQIQTKNLTQFQL